MPRPPRLELAGGIHHVTARSPSQRLLFRDDRDRVRYLELLTSQVADRKWRLLTYCQMTNHLHLLVRTPEPDLGEGIKAIHEEFARYVNRRYEEHGHVFGHRFRSKPVLTERHLLGCFRYIARNPVEAAMCDVPAAWPWSAHRALGCLEPAPDFLDVSSAHECFSSDPSKARLAYLRLTSATDQELLSDLSRAHPHDWLRCAADDFAVPIAELMRFLGTSQSTVYRLLAGARAAAL